MVGRTHQFSRSLLLLAAALMALYGRPNAAVGQAGVAAPLAGPQAAQRGQTERESRWSVLGRSVEERVVEYRRFGQGDQQVLVIGPLDGDALAVLELIELLADHLEQFPRRTDGVRVTLVRDPNPDGRLRRSPYNARGVRLDQNFPTRGWHKIPSGANWPSGREPESEPETRLLVDLVDDVRPDRVIVLAATHRQPELTYFGPAEEWAREFAKAGGLRPAAAQVTAWQGSLAAYSGDDKKTPTLVLRVPSSMRADQLWTTYKRALLATIGAEPEDQKVSAGVAAARPSPSQPAAVLATVKGTSKVPAPPPEKAASRVLTADELQSGGELVPVVRPPAKPSPVASVKQDVGPAVVTKPPSMARFGAAISPSQNVGRAPKQSVPYSTRYREAAPPYGGVPPAALFRPNTTAAGPPAQTAPIKPATPPKQVDRLPPVEPAPPAPKTLPQPIPLYPDTGY